MCECVRTRDEHGEWLTLCPVDTDMYDEQEERRAELSAENDRLRAENERLTRENENPGLRDSVIAGLDDELMASYAAELAAKGEAKSLRAQTADLLEAMEAVRALAENDMCSEVIAAADAAIAKAKGGVS